MLIVAQASASEDAGPRSIRSKQQEQELDTSPQVHKSVNIICEVMLDSACANPVRRMIDRTPTPTNYPASVIGRLPLLSSSLYLTIWYCIRLRQESYKSLSPSLFSVCSKLYSFRHVFNERKRSEQ